MSKCLSIALLGALVGSQAFAQTVQTNLLLQQSQQTAAQSQLQGQCTHPAFTGELAVQNNSFSAPSQATIAKANAAIMSSMASASNSCGGRSTITDSNGVETKAGIALNSVLDGVKEVSKSGLLLKGDKHTRKVAASCDGDVPDFSRTLNGCESLAATDGKGKRGVSATKVSGMRNELEDLIGRANCKADAAEKAAAALCQYEAKYNGLKTAMGSMQEDLLQDEKLLNQCFNFTKTQVEAEQSKVTSLQQKSDSLSTSITRIKEITNQYIGSGANCASGAACGKLAGFQQEIKNHKTKLAAFEKTKRRRVSEKLTQCMMDVGGTTVAGPFSMCKDDDGKITNSIKCIGRLYRDEIMKGRAGSGQRRNFNDLDKNKANNDRDTAETYIMTQLSGLANNIAEDSSLSLDSMSGASVLETSSGKAVLSNLAKSFGSAVSNNMQLQLSACSRFAVASSQEELLSDAGLGADRLALEGEKANMDSNAAGMLQDLGGAFREAVSEAFNQQPNNAFNSLDCSQNFGKSAKTLDEQAACVKGLATTLNALIDGTATGNNSQPVLMPIPGLTAGSADCAKINRPACTCAGFLDCHDVIAKQLIPNAQANIASMKGAATYQNASCPNQACPGQAAVATLGNAWIKGRMDAFGKSFSGMMQGNLQALTALKGQLQKAGLGSVKVPATGTGKAFKCEPQGDAGLCAIPADFSTEMASIAGLNDIDLDALANKTDDAQAQSAKMTEKATKLAQLQGELEELQASCAKEDADKKVEKKFAGYEADADALGSNCIIGARRAVRNGAADPSESNSFSNMLSALDATCSDKVTEDDVDTKQRCARIKVKIASAKENCAVVYDEAASRKANPYFYNQPPQQLGGNAVSVGGDGRVPASNGGTMQLPTGN